MESAEPELNQPTVGSPTQLEFATFADQDTSTPHQLAKLAQQIAIHALQPPFAELEVAQLVTV